jgi:hypothetical protein
VRFTAGVKVTPEVVREKMVAEWRLVRAGEVLEEMG